MNFEQPDVLLLSLFAFILQTWKIRFIHLLRIHLLDRVVIVFNIL